MTHEEYSRLVYRTITDLCEHNISKAEAINLLDSAGRDLAAEEVLEAIREERDLD